MFFSGLSQKLAREDGGLPTIIPANAGIQSQLFSWILGSASLSLRLIRLWRNR
jgi:hypothetical protein